MASLLIITAVLVGTSLWLSSNGVTDNLVYSWNINFVGIGILTNAVQLGFVAGTLCFGLSGVADRFKPNHFFLLYVLCLGHYLMPYLLYGRLAFGWGLAYAF